MAWRLKKSDPLAQRLLADLKAITNADRPKPKRKKSSAPGDANKRGSKLEELFDTQLRTAKIIRPQREFVFHPTRKWRFDFAWPDADPPLAIEIQGATWKGAFGGHTSGKGYEGDREKVNAAVLLGWRVFEVTSRQVKAGYALRIAQDALGKAQSKRASPV